MTQFPSTKFPLIKVLPLPNGTGEPLGNVPDPGDYQCGISQVTDAYRVWAPHFSLKSSTEGRGLEPS